MNPLKTKVNHTLDLIESEVCRDGGSLSATVSDGDIVTSFWLQSSAWNRPSDKGHLELFVTHGPRPETKDIMIEIGSSDEIRWLNFLSEVSVEGAASHRLSLLLRLTAATHYSGG